MKYLNSQFSSLFLVDNTSEYTRSGILIVSSIQCPLKLINLIGLKCICMKFSGFAFGTTSTTTSTTGTPATGGFSFGGAAAGTSAQKPPAFSGFGTPSSGQNTGGFSFGQPSQQQVCNFFYFVHKS